MTSFSPKLIYSFDEFTQCVYESPLRSTSRTCGRRVMLTPITGDFNGSLRNGALLDSPSKAKTYRERSPKRPLTPFCHSLIPTKCAPKISKVSILKVNKTWHIEEENRLRGGATIVAKLPYSRCIERGRKHYLDNLRFRKGEPSIKCSSDLASVSSITSTPRPQLLSLGSNRLRATSSSGQSSSEKGCCPYHIRVRKRNASDSNGLNDDEIGVSSPRYSRCSDATSVIRVHSALSANTALMHKPPASSRLPKRALSIEDAIIHLSKRFSSPPSDFTASSSSSSNHKKLVHRTLSTNRITDELRAKLGLTPPHKRASGNKPSGQLLTSYKRPGSYERIINGHGVGTQTTLVQQPPTRSFSDSQLDLITKKNKIKCNRCFHNCPLDDGCFTCDTCIEVQRVKNAFVIEIFADRPSSQDEDAKPEQVTCYGVRVGAGILPVIVMFVSLIICSVVLLSDSVMSNVCGHYCNMPIGRHSSPQTSMWEWLDPYN